METSLALLAITLAVMLLGLVLQDAFEVMLSGWHWLCCSGAAASVDHCLDPQSTDLAEQ